MCWQRRVFLPFFIEGVPSLHNALLQQIRSYCERREASHCQDPLDLTGKDLSFLDLRDLDLEGVNFTRANLAYVLLRGTRLQGATITDTQFTGVSLDALLAAGVAPEDLLRHRSLADRQEFRPLHFGPEATEITPLQLTGEECEVVCLALRRSCWEELVDEVIFSTLYPDQPWSQWVARCTSRTILDWALVHRARVSTFMDNVPFYGRVLPTTLIDEVKPSDLVAGMKTLPEQALHALGIWQIIKQSDLTGEDVSYPISPYGDGNGVVQIKSRRELQLEGGLMRLSVVYYDEACLRGECFIYHIGPPAPFGSMLGLSAQGCINQHLALDDGVPSQQERNLLSTWLKERGIDQEEVPLMERVCARLRLAGVVEVTFQIYWYEDEDTLDSVEVLDAQGNIVAEEIVSERDLWGLVEEGYGTDINWSWQLSVNERRLERIGAAIPPEDDDYYNDEPEDDDDENWGEGGYE
jgi:hypothetical protein